MTAKAPTPPPRHRLDCPDRALELLSMTVLQATRARWEDGRAKYGDRWVGRSPSLEGYMEALDLRNYIDEAVRHGEIGTRTALWMRAQAGEIAAVLQQHARRVPQQQRREPATMMGRIRAWLRM